jgi:hypothetical protein
MYQVEIVWNREFTYIPFGKEWETIEEAKKFARSMKDSGDGARVKKAQIIDLESNGEIVVQNHEI